MSMIVIEVDLWVLILLAVAFFLLLLHVMFGDLMGKVLFNYLKHKEKDKQKDAEGLPTEDVQ